MNAKNIRAVQFLMLATAMLALAGCETVKPWQRGKLADYTMRPDRDSLGDMADDHVFFSREATTGGRGVGGGGCGCN